MNKEENNSFGSKLQSWLYSKRFGKLNIDLGLPLSLIVPLFVYTLIIFFIPLIQPGFPDEDFKVHPLLFLVPLLLLVLGLKNIFWYNLKIARISFGINLGAVLLSFVLLYNLLRIHSIGSDQVSVCSWGECPSSEERFRIFLDGYWVYFWDYFSF